jgi:hypothetical protein
MGHDRVTYANNSRPVQSFAQIYLVRMAPQIDDLPLSLLQSGTLGLGSGRPAVRNPFNSMTKQVLTSEPGRLRRSCTAIARQARGWSWFRIGQCYLNVIFVRGLS